MPRNILMTTPVFFPYVLKKKKNIHTGDPN